ncbi:hypothetical protein H0484_03955 [Pusillimonas sp. CC-YST705]|uniref:Type IVB pilus formation outer membrane protein, R64 PilN family n=1 Tax=Mesopusillimonas faecipullorum TaxID=2755040 RepID=A0ABS8CA41_9BURK|nr:hypothetical protein [Mesopusillimonas faecipullorum]MCB5362909.1 hypothetical protein [Mesopusillimonas faecipullorum]
MSGRLIALIPLLWLGGCALLDMKQQVDTQAAQAKQELQQRQQGFRAALNDEHARRASRHVDRPWLAGKAQPLARELVLPPALRANVQTTMIFSEPAADLEHIAQRITQATGIPVQVKPDATWPLTWFGPRMAAQGAQGSSNQAGGSLSGWMLEGGPAPLAQLLDRLAARLGVSWRYENERIEFYRLETRVFELPSMLLDAQAEAAMGSSDGQTEGGFSSVSRTTLSSGQAPLVESLRQRVEAFLTQAGQVVAVQGASASLVVTDTPEVLRRVAQYLERENRVLTRRVRILFEELTLALDERGELGIDWQGVFTHARAMAAMGSGAPVENAVGSVSALIAQGPFQGSELLLQALGSSGKVVRRHVVPVLTLNRRPVTHAVRTTFSYIDEVQTTAVRDDAALALPAVSVSQKRQTVGTLITLVPDVREDGRILMSVAYDSTTAQPLKTIRFGDQEHPLQLQQLTVEGNGTVQQLALQPGQPLVIAGFDKVQSSTEERRLNPGAPLLLGGGDTVAQQRLTTLMVITAQVEEG